MSATVITSIAGLLLAATSLVVSRIVTRRVRVQVHRAYFVAGDPNEYYFINVVNLSLNRDVEITHVWLELPTKVHVLRKERPLPKRLKGDEEWSTWIEVSRVPNSHDAEVYTAARVRLSSGAVVKSKQNLNVPAFGAVAGGSSADASSLLRFSTKKVPKNLKSQM